MAKQDFLWKRIDDKKVEKYHIFRSTVKDRILITTKQFDGKMYYCKNNNFYYFEDCYEVIEMPLMVTSSCNPLINFNYSMKYINGVDLPLKYNMLQNEVHQFQQELYPFCRQDEILNTKPIRELVDTWLKSISLLYENPLWFQPYSKEPFDDNTDPHIEIHLNYFAGRKNFVDKNYQIYSHTKLLNTGRIDHGKIHTKITTNTIDDWIGPLKIVIGKFSSRLNYEVEKQDGLVDNFIIHGQLHLSKLSGIVRILGTLPNDPEDVCEESTSPALGFIGHYKNGIPSGHCWKGLLGGSWIYGKVDDNGDFSGDDIAYINQDMSTAFRGRFSKGVMIKAKSVDVIGHKCNKEGIKIIEFSNSSSSCSSSDEEYHFERPTFNSFGDQPLMIDPLDRKYVRLGISNINTKEKSRIIEQNGAFANIDIPPGTVFAHNNGYILSKNQRITSIHTGKMLLGNKQTLYNSLEKEDNNICFSEDDWKYATKLNCGMTLDIPFEAGQDPSKYRSTRGHKINHCFSNMNAFLTSYDSARFGIISAISSRYGITIPKEEELFVHYGYDYSGGPTWYKELFKDFLFGKEPSKRVRQNKVKDCYLSDNTKMDVDNCANYLNDIKNKIISSTNITSVTDASNKRLDSILKLHKSFAVQSIHSLSNIDDYLMSVDKL